MRPLSLKTAVVLGISFGILVPALIVGLFLAQERYERGMEVQVTSLLRQYGDMLAQTLPAPVWQLDTRGGQSIVNAIMSNPSVIKISVEDPSLGQILVAENPRMAGGEVVTDVRPILWEGRPIGKVFIEMSTAQVERELFENLLKVVIALSSSWLAVFRSCVRRITLFSRSKFNSRISSMCCAKRWRIRSTPCATSPISSCRTACTGCDNSPLDKRSTF